jgi:Leucyl-tRNA synthetase
MSQPEDDTGQSYDFRELEAKWQAIWEDSEPFTVDDPNDTRPRKYILDMFPYPSGDLHMGHAEVYALGDIVAPVLATTGFSGSPPHRLGFVWPPGRKRGYSTRSRPPRMDLQQHRPSSARR